MSYNTDLPLGTVIFYDAGGEEKDVGVIVGYSTSQEYCNEVNKNILCDVYVVEWAIDTAINPYKIRHDKLFDANGRRCFDVRK
tara:strand:+ start:162 stop:410 length:249 start_codon:yes stop_codon:yes gene_type:complete